MTNISKRAERVTIKCPMYVICLVYTAYICNFEWKYTCQSCGQYFKLNVASTTHAYDIYKYVIGGGRICRENEALNA